MKDIKLNVPQKLWERLEFAAAQNEIDAETLAIGVLEMTSSLDQAIWPTLTHISLKHNVAEGLVLQNSVIIYLALKISWEENFPGQEFPFPEFVRWKGGIKTGLAYLDQLVDFFKGQNQWGKRLMEEFANVKPKPLISIVPKAQTPMTLDEELKKE